jgi:hypothetical protein
MPRRAKPKVFAGKGTLILCRAPICLLQNPKGFAKRVTTMNVHAW